jgi:hypothetical protein
MVLVEVFGSEVHCQDFSPLLVSVPRHTFSRSPPRVTDVRFPSLPLSPPFSANPHHKNLTNSSGRLSSRCRKSQSVSSPAHQSDDQRTNTPAAGVRTNVQQLLDYSLNEKKRNFLETVELQIGLKNYDPQRDKRFSGTIKLPTVPRPGMAIW